MTAIRNANVLIACALISTALPIVAQTPAANEKKNLLNNPGLEKTQVANDPWDGTSTQGLLEVQKGTLPVLTKAGSIGNTAMPVSVSVGDLNGDGLLDLLTADVFGYMRVYFNSGTPQEPKFTKAELLPINLSRPREGNPRLNEVHDSGARYNHGDFLYRGPRVHLADASRKGTLDIWMGNYAGEIFLFPNTGSAAAPDFRAPPNLSRIRIPTTSEPGRHWGNVFAPAILDFNGDGKADLIVGEGSYSANSIHLLLNQGNNTVPKFTEGQRHFLAYGMGREQLTPALVDYTGNGKPDLLIADSSGKIGFYRNNSVTWNPEEQFEFVSYLSGGGDAAKELSFGGIPTVAAGDFSGNGTFDLVVGKTNGRIAFVKNTGTKTEPAFAAPVELKGDKSPGVRLPSGWEVTYGYNKTNFLGYATLVTNESDPNAGVPEGEHAIKFGYRKNTNLIIKSPFVWGEAIKGGYNRFLRDPFNVLSAPNFFGLRQSVKLKVGQTYTISFRARGARASNAQVEVHYLGVKRLGEMKTQAAGRGEAVVILDRNEVREEIFKPLPVSVGGNWVPVSTDFKVDFTKPELNELETVNARITIQFNLAPGSGEMYFDDFKLVEK